MRRRVGVHCTTGRLGAQEGPGVGIEAPVEGKPGVDTRSGIEHGCLDPHGPSVGLSRLGMKPGRQAEDDHADRENADAEAAEGRWDRDHAGG